MHAKHLLVAVCLAVTASFAVAEPPKDAKSAAKPEAKLPPGWTEADMQAFIAAATPGKMHEYLRQDIGEWEGKNTMWMAPGAEPVPTKSTSRVTALMDGRFTKIEINGEMPGMGPYLGVAIVGYDNISQKFVSTWIDNMSTSMAQGEGELSKDGKTLSWTYTCNCPLTKKPISMRQIETSTGLGKKTIEMFGADPKSGKEYQMMRIELTKK